MRYFIHALVIALAWALAAFVKDVHLTIFSCTIVIYIALSDIRCRD